MMKFFSDLKVSAKLLVSFSLLVVISFAVGGLGIFNILRLQQMDHELYVYQTLPLLELRVIHGAFEENRSYMRDLILEENPAKVDSYLKAMDENKEKIDQSLQTFSQSLLTREENKQFTYLVNVLENFGYHRDQVVELCRIGNKTYAYTVLSQDGPKLSANFSAAMDKLSQIKEQTGHVAAETNEARAESAIWQTGFFVLVAGILALALSITIARLISTPLAAVAAAANEIAGGNLTCEIPAKYRSSRDEIGRLGMVFNDMIENIRNLIQKVHESSEMVAASSEELSASAGDTAQVVGEVALTVGATAEGAQTQVDALAETMSAVEQMVTGVQQIASNSAQATEVAEKAANAALLGGQKVDLVINKMTNIKQSVEHSAAVVAELGSRSTEIDEIVTTISGLAEQTNLLALNAAIEAARAGEEGKGFAVVAEEVRKLAEQSHLAAKQIAALIQSIQSDTSKAVATMNEGTRKVQEGYEAVNEAGEAFASIVSLAQTVSEQIRKISRNIEGMALSSQSMVATVGKVEQISRQTSDQAQTVYAATEEQSSTIEEIAASCDMLAQLADQMQQAVRQFKV